MKCTTHMASYCWGARPLTPPAHGELPIDCRSDVHICIRSDVHICKSDDHQL